MKIMCVVLLERERFKIDYGTSVVFLA